MECVIQQIYTFLIGKQAPDNNIVRKHTRKLKTLGEISFPSDINCWHQFTQEFRDEDHSTIFEYSSKIHGRLINEQNLLEESKSWNLHIDSIPLLNGSYHMFLNRKACFEFVIGDVLQNIENFGAFNFDETFNIEVDKEGETEELNLSELRLVLMKKVGENLLRFNKGLGTDEKNEERNVLLTLKSTKKNDRKLVSVVGAVLNEGGSKNFTTTAEEYHRQRTIDMRMMAEHKYGLRITSKPGWEDVFMKLGNAAVIIDLLHNKPCTTITINLNDHYIKNASFILYNCARLSGLFKEFDKKVTANVYPALPPLENIAFGLLDQEEEWELLFVHVLQFPLVIKSCIKDIGQARINIHYLISMLSNMTSLFSIYYRRVRILTDPRPHLFPVLHARIYLLKAIEQVLHNSLRLLNIEPVKQM